MSAIFPFRALRPVPESAPRVAAVPYDVVTSDEARALADGNPVSFLHVSRPEIDLPADADPHSEIAYAKAADNFAALRQAAPLVVEDAPRFYVYRLTMGTHTQSGVAACFSVDEYDDDLIRKHEKTRPDKEDDRTRHLLAIGAQTGPVFLTYKASVAIDAVVRRTVTEAPLFDFVGERRRAARGVARAPERGTGADRGILRGAGALHRRRSPSSRECGPGPRGLCGPRRGRVGSRAGRGLSGQPDAGAAVQPRGPQTSTGWACRRSWTRSAPVGS